MAARAGPGEAGVWAGGVKLGWGKRAKKLALPAPQIHNIDACVSRAPAICGDCIRVINVLKSARGLRADGQPLGAPRALGAPPVCAREGGVVRQRFPLLGTRIASQGECVRGALPGGAAAPRFHLNAWGPFGLPGPEDDPMRWTRTALALTTALSALTVLGCGEDATGPSAGGTATIQGRVEEAGAGAAGAPAYRSLVGGGAASVSAEKVVVAQMEANGSLSALAEATVNADGTFAVQEVPAGREHLVVVAHGAGGAEVGRVMVHGRTRAGATVTAAPITYESTLRARAWAQVRASGRASATSPAEVALLVRTGSAASAAVLANQEVTAVADGLTLAGEAMTRVFAGSGRSMDASARAQALTSAAEAYARARFNGAGEGEAHDAYARAALDGWLAAGVSAEAVSVATASAATLFDARLEGRSGARGALVSEAVRMNLRARQRLAAGVQSGSHASVALAVLNVLASTEASVRGATSAAAVRAALDVQAAASAGATVGAILDLLVPNASLAVRAQVQAKAQAAVDAARLSARLSAAASPEAAAQAVAGYRGAVRAAVVAMLEASGRTDLNADALTTLYIAAHGGAHIRA